MSENKMPGPVPVRSRRVVPKTRRHRGEVIFGMVVIALVLLAVMRFQPSLAIAIMFLIGGILGAFICVEYYFSIRNWYSPENRPNLEQLAELLPEDPTEILELLTLKGVIGRVVNVLPPDLLADAAALSVAPVGFYERLKLQSNRVHSAWVYAATKAFPGDSLGSSLAQMGPERLVATLLDESFLAPVPMTTRNDVVTAFGNALTEEERRQVGVVGANLNKLVAMLIGSDADLKRVFERVGYELAKSDQNDVYLAEIGVKLLRPLPAVRRLELLRDFQPESFDKAATSLVPAEKMLRTGFAILSTELRDSILLELLSGEELLSFTQQKMSPAEIAGMLLKRADEETLKTLCWVFKENSPAIYRFPLIDGFARPIEEDSELDKQCFAALRTALTTRVAALQAAQTAQLQGLVTSIEEAQTALEEAYVAAEEVDALEAKWGALLDELTKFDSKSALDRRTAFYGKRIQALVPELLSATDPTIKCAIQEEVARFTSIFEELCGEKGRLAARGFFLEAEIGYIQKLIEGAPKAAKQGLRNQLRKLQEELVAVESGVGIRA